MHTVLRPPGGTLAAAGIGAAGGRLPRARASSWRDHGWRLAGHFRRCYGLTSDTVTGGELRAARDLARTKFARSEWTARVP